MKRNHWLMFLIISLSFILITACGSDNESGGTSDNGDKGDSESGEEAGEQEEVEISFAWWGDTGRHDKYNEIIDGFEEEYPHITVQRELGGWDDYWDRLTTQVSGGNAPDVVSMHQFYISDYARRGALHNLNDMVAEGTIDLSEFPEAAVNSGKIDGENFMIAKGITMPGYVYNTAFFEELGIEPPAFDWTWEEFPDKLREIGDAMGEDQWATEDLSGGQLQPNLRYYVRSYGQDLFTEDGKLGFDEELLTDWWTMWDELRQDGYIPDAATGNEYDGLPLEANMFATNVTALLQLPANQIYLYEEQFDEGEVHIIRHPRAEDGPNPEYIEGAYLSITEESDHKEEAALFIDYFINNEDAVRLFKTEQGPPAGTEASNIVMEELSPPEARAVEFIQQTSELAEDAPYAPTGVNEVETLYSDNADAIAFGEKTVEQAVEDFMSQAKSILGE